MTVLILASMLHLSGCSTACTAGIIANFEKEVGPTLDPCIASKSGLGLPQLAGALRRRYLAESGRAWCSAQGQVRFVVKVLGEMGIRDRLFVETSPERAAVLFARRFERPRSYRYGPRAARARQIYKNLTGRAN